MTILSWQKFPVARVLVNVSNLGHLNGRSLVKTCRKLLLNSV